MGAPESNTTNIYGIHLRESANDGSDFSNAAADYRVLFLGEDGELHVKDSSGTVTDPFTAGSGTGQGLVDFAHAKRTSGDVTLSADAIWADVDTGLDLVMTASSGDVVEVGFSGGCFNATAVSVNFDAVSVVSASPVNSFATGAAPDNANNGVAAWRIGSGASEAGGGSIMYALQAGDISGGTVTIRLRYRTASSTNRVLDATAVNPVHFWARNLGAAL